MLSTALLLAASMVVGQAEEQNDPLKEYAEDFLGSWVNEKTAEEDSDDGSVKKGDKIKVDIVVEWWLEPSVIKVDYRRVTLSNEKKEMNIKGIAFWDPRNKQIVTQWFMESGLMGKVTHVKHGNEWTQTWESHARDGAKYTEKRTVRISDNNDTHHIVATNRVFDGEKQEDIEITFHRQ